MKANDVLNKIPPALRRRPILIAVVTLLAVVLLWSLLRPSGSQTSATAYYTVKRGDFTVSITEGGTLAAVSEISIRNEVEGTARIIFIAKEGSYVRKGDLLVELDSSQANDQVNQQQINFEKAQYALIAAQHTLDIQRSQTNSDITAARLKRDLAKLDLDKYERGQRLVDEMEAANKLFEVEAQLAMDLNEYINTTNLTARGYETKLKEDSDRLAVMRNQNALVTASNQVWMLREFDQKKQRAQFTANVDEAEQELERVLQQSERRMAQYVADLLTQSNTLVLNERKLERDRKNLDACRIEAPQDGLVVYPMSDDMRFRSDSMVEEGATVRNRQELIKLPDVSRMKVTVKVHESTVNMVQPNQPAFVVLDSMPDHAFRAHVERVALLPDTTSRFGNPNLKVYNTEIHIDDQLPDVKPGVSARAEIVITNIANALSVPIQAVTTLKGKQVCYRLEGGQPQPVPVEVGLFNTRFIQIVSGLEDGDRVLLSPPFDAEQRDLEGTVLASEERARMVATNTPAVSAASPAPNGRRPAPGTVGQAGEVPGAALAGTPGGVGRRNAGADLGAAAPGGGAPEAAGTGGGRQRGAGGQRGGFDREAMMKQYDKDGDGELNDEERQAMRAEMQQRFGGMGGGGPGGPGGAGGGGRGGGGGFGGAPDQGSRGEPGAGRGSRGGEGQGGGGRQRTQPE